MAPDQSRQASGLTVPHPRVTGGSCTVSAGQARGQPVRHPQRLAAHPLRRFGQPRRRLRAGLVQLLFAVAGLGLGLLLPRITVAPTVASSRVTETLIGVGFGVLGLVSIIFSLLFLVVQWAFSSPSPRNGCTVSVTGPWPWRAALHTPRAPGPGRETRA
ncbi:MAG TPA: hypothetical protein VHS32_35500 [Streptosporangiaceae bacterium]|nr:hypothetical protein [Streptosporangiaceae bacterium]